MADTDAPEQAGTDAPPDDTSKPGGKPGPGGKGVKQFGKDHKESILVIVSILGLVVAYLTFKKGSGTSSATPASASTGATAGATGGSLYPSAGSGDVAGYNGDAGSGFDAYVTSQQAAIGNQLSNLQTTVTSIQGTPTSPSLSLVKQFQSQYDAHLSAYQADAAAGNAAKKGTPQFAALSAQATTEKAQALSYQQQYVTARNSYNASNPTATYGV